MQSITQPTVEHSIESAGVDWITASATKGSTRWDMQTFADNQRRRFMDAERPIKMGYRLGYHGWQADGFFHGQREGGSIIVASGATAHEVHRSVAEVSDHISRIDLQVTIKTPEDTPHLARHAYSVLKGGSPSRVKVKNATLIDSHPQGETCNVGKRSSDTYGRIYDKASESGKAPALTLWRYEVEFKRNPANAIAARLRADPPVEAVACGLVHEWFTARGVVPLFTPAPLLCPHKPVVTEGEHDVLAWFERSLSVTVAKAIGRYGVARTFEALRLTHYLPENRERSK